MQKSKTFPQMNCNIKLKFSKVSSSFKTNPALLFTHLMYVFLVYVYAGL